MKSQNRIVWTGLEAYLENRSKTETTVAVDPDLNIDL